MLRRPGRILLLAGLAILVLLILGRVAVGFYTDILWYGELGHLATYWRRLWISLSVRAVAALIGAMLIFVNLWLVARHLGPVRVRRRYGNIEIAEQIPRKYVVAVALVLAVLGGWWLAQLQFGEGAALGVAGWLERVSWGVADPFYGRDVSFYVFGLPVALNLLEYLILVAVWGIALVTLGHVLVGGVRWEENRLSLSVPARLHLGILLASMILLLGLRYWLGRYLLVVDGNGVGGGLGFTDVEARLPAYWGLALLSAAAAATLVWGAWKGTLLPPVIGLGALLTGGVLLGTAYPAFVQKFRVEPNELSREAPYIRWNIEFTRRAYDLDNLARKRFPYRAGAAPDPRRIEPLIARLPLWDPSPLQRTFDERQALFTYYRFPDVDYDRYGPPGEEVQVGIGVREFYPQGLAQENRTWQSLHLNPEYIRGMGAVAAPAHPNGESGGAATLWVRNIRPVITAPEAPDELEMSRASVFFGETTAGYAVVVPGRDSAFLGQPGVSYPPGIPVSSFLRVLAFAWRFGDETLLFSGDVSRDSRIIFRRSLRERVQEIVPFLLWDEDPLPVMMDGRIVWLLDGYTISSSYPLARPVQIAGGSVRYLRNSVKATIDAISGAVRLYVVDEEDPLLATYSRVYPGLFRPLAEMPAPLRRHLRYPELALLAQAEILQEYHVDRAEVFYAGQDVWQRPQETAPAGGMQDYRPTYALVPVPLEPTVEYLALLPFIARARQNMTAMLWARNDQDRYGQLTLLEFPRDEQIPGPGQVQAMIEQDPIISPELSLLRQRGSGVDMGHLRVVPLDSSVLYVQPLFLSADENPIPELWRVVVSDGRDVTMSTSFVGALERLQVPVGDTRPAARPRQPTGGQAWPRRALELLEQAERRLRDGDWAGYGRSMEELRRFLEGLEPEDGPDPG